MLVVVFFHFLFASWSASEQQWTNRWMNDMKDAWQLRQAPTTAIYEGDNKIYGIDERQCQIRGVIADRNGKITNQNLFTINVSFSPPKKGLLYTQQEHIFQLRSNNDGCCFFYHHSSPALAMIFFLQSVFRCLLIACSFDCLLLAFMALFSFPFDALSQLPICHSSSHLICLLWMCFHIQFDLQFLWETQQWGKTLNTRWSDV